MEYGKAYIGFYTKRTNARSMKFLSSMDPVALHSVLSDWNPDQTLVNGMITFCHQLAKSSNAVVESFLSSRSCFSRILNSLERLRPRFVAVFPMNECVTHTTGWHHLE